jgi:hypothetical protein
MRKPRSRAGDRAPQPDGFLPAPTRRIPWLDLGLVALAVVFAFPSFWYPFGRDQAAHAYIGWGWLHGFIPFRDAVDQKPPGIYFLYTLGSLIFGERQFGIRVLDFCGILLGGWLATRATARIAPRRAGETGALILLVTGFYYTCFDYWDTAQAEIWQALAVLAGVVVLREATRPRRAAFATGVLGGVALLFKPTAGVLCLGLAALLARRAWSEGGFRRERAARILRWGGLQVLGGVSVLALAAAYFAACGALGPAIDLAVRYNLAYGSGWRTAGGVARTWSFDFWILHSGVWAAILLGPWCWAAIAARRRDDRSFREVAAVPGGLLALGAGAVMLQGKFFGYHWGVMTPLLALAAAAGVAEAGRRCPRLLPWAAAGAVLVGFLLAPTWICNRAAKDARPTTYLRMTAATWSYLFGQTPRSEYLRPFDGSYGYRYADQEAMGLAVRDRSRPGDLLLVRGFEPTPYIVSGLRCPSRFFIEMQLTERRVTFARETWIAEYNRAMAADPPRFVAIQPWKTDQIEHLLQKGFRRGEQHGTLVLYERG